MVGRLREARRTAKIKITSRTRGKPKMETKEQGLQCHILCQMTRTSAPSFGIWTPWNQSIPQTSSSATQVKAILAHQTTTLPTTIPVQTGSTAIQAKLILKATTITNPHTQTLNIKSTTSTDTINHTMATISTITTSTEAKAAAQEEVATGKTTTVTTTNMVQAVEVIEGISISRQATMVAPIKTIKEALGTVATAPTPKV